MYEELKSHAEHMIAQYGDELGKICRYYWRLEWVTRLRLNSTDDVMKTIAYKELAIRSRSRYDLASELKGRMKENP